jgi:ribosomal protein S12 methylthiotransferase accessory factor
MQSLLQRHGAPVSSIVADEAVWLRSRHGVLRLPRSQALLAALGEPDGWARAPEGLRGSLAAHGIGPAPPPAPQDQGCATPLSVPAALAALRPAGLSAVPIDLATLGDDRTELRQPCLVYLHAGLSVLLGVLDRWGPCPRCVRTRLQATYPFAAVGDAPLRSLLDPPAAHCDPGHRGCSTARRRLEAAIAYAVRDSRALLEIRLGPGRPRLRPRPLLPLPGCPGCPAAVEHRPAAGGADGDGLAGALRRYLRLVDARTAVVAGVMVQPCGSLVEARTWTRIDTRRFSSVRAHVGGAAVKPGREEAVVAALGETFERYAAGVMRSEALIWARLVDLVEPTVEPRELLDLGPSSGSRRRLEEFDPEREIGWVRAVPVEGGAPRLVPAAAVHLPYPARAGERFLVPNSIGLAAGTSLHDATRRALLEILERYAWQQAWARRAIRAPVRLGRCCAEMARLLETVSAGGASAWAADITTAPGVPTVVAGAVSAQRADRPLLAMGLRAAATLHDAVTGALCEVVQSQLHVAALLPVHDVPPSAGEARTLDDRYLFYCHPERLARLGFLWPPGDSGTTPAPHHSTRRAGLGTLCRTLRREGLQPLVVDLTPVDLGAAGVHVARALARVVDTAARARASSGFATPAGLPLPPPRWPPPGC